MKNSIESVLSTLIKTATSVDQLRKVAINKDISIVIDGKDYPISKKTSDNSDELVKLKSRAYDLELSLKDLIQILRAGMIELTDSELEKLDVARGLIFFPIKK